MVMLNITWIFLRLQSSVAAKLCFSLFAKRIFLLHSHFTDAVSCFPLYLQAKYNIPINITLTAVKCSMDPER